MHACVFRVVWLHLCIARPPRLVEHISLVSVFEFIYVCCLPPVGMLQVCCSTYSAAPAAGNPGCLRLWLLFFGTAHLTLCAANVCCLTHPASFMYTLLHLSKEAQGCSPCLLTLLQPSLLCARCFTCCIAAGAALTCHKVATSLFASFDPCVCCGVPPSVATPPAGAPLHLP